MLREALALVLSGWSRRALLLLRQLRLRNASRSAVCEGQWDIGTQPRGVSVARGLLGVVQ